MSDILQFIVKWVIGNMLFKERGNKMSDNEI